VSGQARAVILQHAPGRREFKWRDEKWPIPSIKEEVELIRLYGSKVVAVTLNNEKSSPAELIEHQRRLTAELGLPVIRPLEEGLDALLPVIRDYVAKESKKARKS
jgi:uncharacterized NAD-dependent epimerase/dehydratase family protein